MTLEGVEISKQKKCRSNFSQTIKRKKREEEKRNKKGRDTDRVKGAQADVEQKLLPQKFEEEGSLIGLKFF